MVLLQTRLIPDMLPLIKQIQIACDMATNGAARLAGAEPQSFEDNETTLEQACNRIERAIDYVKSFKPEQIDGSETRTVVLKTRNGEMTFEGQAYLLRLRHPEPVLPLHHRVQHPARSRHRHRQDGFHRPGVTDAGTAADVAVPRRAITAAGYLRKSGN